MLKYVDNEKYLMIPINSYFSSTHYKMELIAKIHTK